MIFILDTNADLIRSLYHKNQVLSRKIKEVDRFVNIYIDETHNKTRRGIYKAEFLKHKALVKAELIDLYKGFCILMNLYNVYAYKARVAAFARGRSAR